MHRPEREQINVTDSPLHRSESAREIRIRFVLGWVFLIAAAGATGVRIAGGAGYDWILILSTMGLAVALAWQMAARRETAKASPAQPDGALKQIFDSAG